MTNATAIRQLGVGDAEQMAQLRQEALRSSPLAFGSSPDDDRFSSIDAVRDVLTAANQAVFGLIVRDQLQGMVGAHHTLSAKEHHKAYLWGMYVTPEARRRGGGGRLLEAAVQWARHVPGVLQVHLGVTDSALEAGRLYERAGFDEWGVEPRALRWQDEFTAERHLVLRLDEPSDR